MSSSSAGTPNVNEQQTQPSTSSAASLNIQVGAGGHPGSMASPHPGSTPQPGYNYPYGGKPLPHSIHRPMAPQQWPIQHGPDGATSDGITLSQPPPANYTGQQHQMHYQQQQGYLPSNMYPPNGPTPTSSSVNSGYWVTQQPPQQQQHPRYPMPSQSQYTPGYGYSPMAPPQGYMYPPQQPMMNWGQPQMPPGYPPANHAMPPPPPVSQQHPPPPPAATAPQSSANIAAAAQALQSPGTSSSHTGQDEAGGDDSKSIRSTSSVPPPQTPARTPAATPSTSSTTPGPSTAKTSTPATSKNAPPPSRTEILEKLCFTTDELPPDFVAHRRAFFEKVLSVNEANGVPLTGPPPVSKHPIDLHKLYSKVREMGGFERVTKDKLWKNLCSIANSTMSESSAAGYQLRRHYEKHLLPLECLETGGNAEELIAMANKTKKKKKEKDPEKAAAGAPTATAGPLTAPSGAPPQQAPGPPQHQQVPPGGPTQPPQMLPPQGYSQPQGPPPLGQPGSSYALDASGQHIQYGSHPGTYPYGVPPPPHGWGAPPMPHGYYQQQPRYPMMMPPGQQTQPGQPPVPAPSQQPPTAPPPSTGPQPSHQHLPPQPPPGQQPIPQPVRPNDPQQQVYEEQQRQLYQQQQQQQQHRPTSSASTPQPPCSTVASTSEQVAPSASTASLQPPSQPSATSRAPSAAPQTQAFTPSSTSTASTAQLPPAATTSAGSESGNTSMLANQLGQPPPMGMYPPHPMGMYRMPYPSHQPSLPGFQQPPTGDAASVPPGHPGMYQHPSQPPQMYGPPQGWSQGMVRYPQTGMPPPTTATSLPSSGSSQPGQTSADFWQQQQRAMTAQQQAQQQGHGGVPRKPGYFPPNQQSSPQPNSRIPSQAAPSQPSLQNVQTNAKVVPPQVSQQPPQAISGPPRQMIPGPSIQQQQQQAYQQSLLQQQQQISHVFPPNSVESIAQHHLGQQRRPLKKFTKDLISASPRRILMALKSNIYMEVVWALNALTVMLYDDHINPPTLSPEILNIIVEHFRASLSLVFPKAFALDDFETTSDSRSPSVSSDLWTRIIEEAKTNGEPTKMKVKLPVAMKSSLGKDLNQVSRLGSKIILKDAEMPTSLKEWKLEAEKENKVKVKKSEMSYDERRKMGLPSDIAYKVAVCTKDFVEQMATKSEKVKYSKWVSSETKHFEYEDDVQPKETRSFTEDKLNDEYFDHEAPLDCYLVPRPIGIFLIPETIQNYSQLCLSWSNVLRGFSFNPANEQYLVNSNGLLRLIGRILMLYVEAGDPPRPVSRRKKQEIDEKEGISSLTIKETTPEEDIANKALEEKKRAAMVSTEKDDTRSFLLDVANQLRDDAFTILSFMSGSLDLFDLDSAISYPIFDALIHWSVSHSVLAKDPLVAWGAIAPRDFCLEIIAKMSVIDRNVDLLLSTGPWRRIEEFVKIVCDLLHMGEEVPIREFALVIMNALCQASESVCIVAALNGNIVKNVLGFMEYIDSKMHDTVSAGSMNELRTNPEAVIGTSIGMLRRAACLLTHIVSHESCRKPFLKYMNNFINLTISHYMDTRVAIMIASIVHMAQLSNVDSSSGKCLDVPNTPSIEPDILFPHKVTTLKKDDSSKEGEDQSRASSSWNGVKRHHENSQPSTSVEALEVKELQHSQINGIQTNGTDHDNIGKKASRINGAHKHVISDPSSPPKQDVKAILRNSINHKQEAAGPAAKKSRMEVNGNNGLMPSPRINGTSPSASSNGSTTTTTNSSTSSTMAIVT